MEKRCGRCKRTKPASEFGRHRSQTDGLNCTCRECCTEQRKASYAKHADKRRSESRERYTKNKERHRANNKAWLEANRDRRAAWQRERRRSNPIATLHHRVSASISQHFRKARGGQKTAELVGYTMQELRAHLERQFSKGMGWHNTSEWHIDHIVPLSSFTITGPDDPEIRRAWALANLRPLWAVENMRKGARRLTLL